MNANIRIRRVEVPPPPAAPRQDWASCGSHPVRSCGRTDRGTSASMDRCARQRRRSKSEKRPGHQTEIAVRWWKRQHSNGIVAEVVPIEGIGVWRADAWRDVPEGLQGDQRSFAHLTCAHAAADAMARERYGHECDQGCGDWQPVERRLGIAAARHPRRRRTD